MRQCARFYLRDHVGLNLDHLALDGNAGGCDLNTAASHLQQDSRPRYSLALGTDIGGIVTPDLRLPVNTDFNGLIVAYVFCPILADGNFLVGADAFRPVIGDSDFFIMVHGLRAVMLDLSGFVVVDGLLAVVSHPVRLVILHFDVLVFLRVDEELLAALLIFKADLVEIRRGSAE